jgi:hypothetical protein
VSEKDTAKTILIHGDGLPCAKPQTHGKGLMAKFRLTNKLCCVPLTANDCRVLLCAVTAEKRTYTVSGCVTGRTRQHGLPISLIEFNIVDGLINMSGIKIKRFFY